MMFNYIQRFKGLRRKNHRHDIRTKLTVDQLKKIISNSVSPARPITKQSPRKPPIFKLRTTKQGFKSADEKHIYINAGPGRLVIPVTSCDKLSQVYDREVEVMRRLRLHETEQFSQNIMPFLETSLTHAKFSQSSPKRHQTPRLSPSRMLRFSPLEGGQTSKRLLQKYKALFEEERPRSLTPLKLGGV
jgi:hypothetical protein